MGDMLGAVRVHLAPAVGGVEGDGVSPGGVGLVLQAVGPPEASIGEGEVALSCDPLRHEAGEQQQREHKKSCDGGVDMFTRLIHSYNKCIF